jgi:hypothetical protein
MFAIPQAINPAYGWTLKSYDADYLKLIQEGFEPPPPSEDPLIGTTAKVFLFQAIKKGRSQAVFADCELDASGRCLRELKVQAFNVTIYE